MDYKKFHRTNNVIELVGSIAAAVWGVVNLFLADGYPTAAFMPIMLAFIIKSVRIITLTGREEYRQEEYAESQKSSYADNRRIVIFSAVFSCIALVLVIVKMIIR